MFHGNGQKSRPNFYLFFNDSVMRLSCRRERTIIQMAATTIRRIPPAMASKAPLLNSAVAVKPPFESVRVIETGGTAAGGVGSTIAGTAPFVGVSAMATGGTGFVSRGDSATGRELVWTEDCGGGETAGGAGFVCGGGVSLITSL